MRNHRNYVISKRSICTYVPALLDREAFVPLSRNFSRLVDFPGLSRYKPSILQRRRNEITALFGVSAYRFSCIFWHFDRDLLQRRRLRRRDTGCSEILFHGVRHIRLSWR